MHVSRGLMFVKDALLLCIIIIMNMYVRHAFTYMFTRDVKTVFFGKPVFGYWKPVLNWCLVLLTILKIYNYIRQIILCVMHSVWFSACVSRSICFLVRALAKVSLSQNTSKGPLLWSRCIVTIIIYSNKQNAWIYLFRNIFLALCNFQQEIDFKK